MTTSSGKDINLTKTFFLQIKIRSHALVQPLYHLTGLPSEKTFFLVTGTSTENGRKMSKMHNFSNDPISKILIGKDSPRQGEQNTVISEKLAQANTVDLVNRQLLKLVIQLMESWIIQFLSKNEKTTSFTITQA
jgi:hypothetical protein